MSDTLGNFFYYFNQAWTCAIPRLVARIHQSGFEHIPKTGPALLLANHISHFDPPLMTMKSPRVIHFMADKPLLEIPVLGPLLHMGHAYPIDRTKPNDLSAIKTTFTRLKAGHIVGIFPERGIRFAQTSVLGGAELPVGTAALWQKADVPVIPMIIIGTDQLYSVKKYLSRPRIFLRVGPALAPDKTATREELRDRIVASWKSLFSSIDQDFHPEPRELPHSAQQRWAGM